MNALMFLQSIVISEWLITHMTAKRPLTNMNALMFLQITTLNE
jgi:hypothetical protein